MRVHKPISLVLLGLLCLLALPLGPHAAVTDNASKVPGCIVADAAPTPAPVGDEDFFTLPGGSISNVMLILDSSTSMMEFPRPIAWNGGSWDGITATTGNCTAVAPFAGLDTMTLSDTPYDNGWVTDDGNMVDDPPWGLTKCTAKQSAPTTDKAIDYCLYRPDSYYKVTKDSTLNSTVFWQETYALTYNNTPCAAVNSSGDILKEYSTNAVVKADEVACKACLDSKGYYIFRARYKSGKSSYSLSPEQIVFSGKFLNAYPQKYIIARKVVKDLVKMDQDHTDNVDGVRFGLTMFQGGEGGRLIVPLGPSCDDSYPLATKKAQYQTARQAIVDAVNRVSTDGKTSTYVTLTNGTPLSEVLLNVGQYFNSTGTTSPYATFFDVPPKPTGADWTKESTTDGAQNFTEKSGGAIGASWASDTSQASFCWACQQSSVVLVTDGEPYNDGGLPNGSVTTNHADLKVTVSGKTYYDFVRWNGSAVSCTSCGTSAYVQKVAYFLKQTDLRTDFANTGGAQTLNTYTISFGLDSSTDAQAINLLTRTAELGGGSFQNTSSGAELKNALRTAVTDVVNKAISFSSSSSSSLQSAISTTADSYLARFKPNDSIFWEGHLFAGMVFDEFGQGCDSRKTTADQTILPKCGTATDVNPNIDEDKYPSDLAVCDSAYIVDSACDPIVENATGSFKKGYFASGKLLAGTDDAVMYWDAGAVLSTPGATGYRSAVEGLTDSRKIYTVLDTDADGKLTSSDGLTEFTRANAALLAPYLALDQTWCSDKLVASGACGGSAPACPAWGDTARVACAKLVIDYIRGYDVMDEDSDHCGGPDNYQNTHGYGTCTTGSTGADLQKACGTTAATCTGSVCYHTACTGGEQRDRASDSRPADYQTFWKLGDIFHSSPILVKPPAGKLECNTGLINQCSYRLYTASTGSPTLEKYGSGSAALDAYDRWRKDIIDRRRLLLVGANDGMFHAFEAGTADTAATPNAEGQHPFSNGTGEELWAFVPPDLLSRLKKALDAHTYFVDGTPMVRDIWKDLNADGIKTKNEFVTIAIISERGGGTHYTGLDVTDPASPKFLWTFPEPGTEDARLVGQTWTDFAPKPPPIGPVKLDKSGGFEERWVAILNGGYDPAMVRGRGIWMVDAYTGKTIWRFTDAEFVAMRGDDKAHMGPVPGSAAMVDIGAANNALGSMDGDGYYDSATFADVFGNLFVARFHTPGTLNASGMVTNWSAARAFEMNRQDGDVQDMSKRSQFFYMPTAVLDPPSRQMVLIGSGNRERLMARTPECSAEDLLGCCKAGCSVASATTSISYGYGCNMGGTFQCSNGAITYTSTDDTDCATGPTATCGATTQTVTFDFTCGGKSTGPLTGTLTCDANGTCSVDEAPGDSMADASALTSCPNHDCMFGVWAYGQSASRKFDETKKDSVKTYESYRFTDNAAYTGTCGTFSSCALVDATSALTQSTAEVLGTKCQDTAVAKCKASNEDPGWKYCYGNYCPTDSCSESSWCDEVTGSALSGGYSSCMQFYSFRPTATGTVSATNPCNSGDVGQVTATSYLVDAITGATSDTCGYHKTSGTTTTHYRAQTTTVGSAPKTSTMRVVVNERGEVSYSTLGETTSGSSKTSLGLRSSTSEPLYILAVPPESHTCRHTAPPTDSTKPRKCE